MPANNASRFMALPAELRNHIYTFAFAPTNKGTAVNLLVANPPTKFLLLASKQIYREAHELYRDAYRAFWQDTHFFIDALAPRPCPQARLHDHNLAHINNITLRTSGKAVDQNMFNRHRNEHRGGDNLGEHCVFRRCENDTWILQDERVDEWLCTFLVDPEKRKLMVLLATEDTIEARGWSNGPVTKAELSTVLGYLIW
ncbi:hypothetical protein LTR86_007021 [Recurvomyces mirabilis]|nr:hypothetical protein LTR86_007021 [Recurvomyces mirabilis]